MNLQADRMKNYNALSVFLYVPFKLGLMSKVANAKCLTIAINAVLVRGWPGYTTGSTLY